MSTWFTAGVLKQFRAMDPYDSLVEHTDPFSEKYIYMNKRDKFIEVKKLFWSLEVINYFAVYINY
jgi:hypothetical protein